MAVDSQITKRIGSINNINKKRLMYVHTGMRKELIYFHTYFTQLEKKEGNKFYSMTYIFRDYNVSLQTSLIYKV